MAKQERTTVEPERKPAPTVLPTALPRAWLNTLAALVLLPWIVALGLYLWYTQGNGIAAVRQEPAGVASSALATGPWGNLAARPIIISPPLEAIPRDWGPMETIEWRFPRITREQVERFLTNSGVAPDQVARLMATSRFDAGLQGPVLKPDPEFLRRLDPQVRAQIYLVLAQTPANPRHHEAYRFAGESTEQWLGGPISPATRQLVIPLIYRHGGFQYLADIELLRSQISDPEEMQRLAKTLFRIATVLVELQVTRDSPVEAIAEYWGRGGRRTDILPLLESVAANAGSVDITHLLPTVARLNLYRYPKITQADLAKPQLVNCLWTALNFFSSDPEEKLGSLEAATRQLDHNYYLVHDKMQLGDIAVYRDEGGNLFHVAIYVADKLVFTKNGLSPLSPWVIMPMEQLKGYYVQFGENPAPSFYRRKDL